MGVEHSLFQHTISAPYLCGTGMENQKATSHPPVYQISHFPQAMPISWNLLHSYPICKPLFSWAGNFASNQLSTILSQMLSWTHKPPEATREPQVLPTCRTLGAPPAALWLHRMMQQRDDTALYNSDSTDPQWGTGRAPLTPYLWLTTPLLAKADLNPKTEEDPK